MGDTYATARLQYVQGGLHPEAPLSKLEKLLCLHPGTLPRTLASSVQDTLPPLEVIRDHMTVNECLALLYLARKKAG